MGGPKIPPQPNTNYSKLLQWEKAAEYKLVRDRLHTFVKLSVGISEDMINRIPPLRSDGEYTNKDAATNVFIILMANMSLDNIPHEQRKDKAKQLLGVVSNLVDDCDMNAFFKGGGDREGGEVPSAALSTPCTEGNNSLTDEELVEPSTSEFHINEEGAGDYITQDENKKVVDGTFENGEVEAFEEGLECESLVDIGRAITTSVPSTSTKSRQLALTRWRKTLINKLYNVDGVKGNVDSFSQLKTKERLPHYSSIDQIKVQQITLLYADHHKNGLLNQELNEKISKVLGGHIYYEGEFETSMKDVRESAKDKIAENKRKKRSRLLARFADIEERAGVGDYFSTREKLEEKKTEKARVEAEMKAKKLFEERKKERAKYEESKKLFEERKKEWEEKRAEALVGKQFAVATHTASESGKLSFQTGDKIIRIRRI